MREGTNVTGMSAASGRKHPRGRRRGVLLGTVLWTALAVVGASLPSAAYPRPGSIERVSVGTDGTEGNLRSSSSSVSADGRYVAFRSYASNLIPGTTVTPTILVRDRKHGTTEQVSVASDGTPSNHNSIWPSLSDDGRYVAFQSFASNLVPDDSNGTWDVFVHDRQTGATERASVAADGSEGNDGSYSPSVSADGRYVAFESRATNLVPGDANTNGVGDIFVHDRETGTTERASVTSDGAEGERRSLMPAISADGGHVAFQSYASNLVPGDTNEAQDVFVHDRETGTTERVSVASDGSEGDGHSQQPAISGDGRYVAFESRAANLVAWDTNEAQDIFVHDRETGTTERVSVAEDGAEANGSSWPASISADGRYVAFSSYASNLVPDDSNEAEDVFVHDRETGTTERVSVAEDGAEGDAVSAGPSIGADGRYVAFHSKAENLVPDVTNDDWDVFVRERGAAVGVGELSALPDGDRISVSGWSTFSGKSVASVSDPPDDGAPGADEAGGELTGASLIYRPEQEDLLVRLRLASLPAMRCTSVVCEWGGGASGAVGPGVLHRRVRYGMDFVVDGIPFEVRARSGSLARTDGTTVSEDLPQITLYRCDPACTEQGRVPGGIGTSGAEVRVSVPLSVIGASEGTDLTQIRAHTSREDGALEDLETPDEADLPDAAIAGPRVSLGIAPLSAPQSSVSFSTQADLVEGRFSGTLDVSDLPAGVYRVWAKGCLGQVCGARSVEVAR